MLGWAYMAVAIVTATVMWPIGRWGMRGDGHAVTLGFWMALSSAILAAVLAVVQGQAWDIWQVWVAGAALGISHSVGFCWCNNRSELPSHR